MLHMIDLYMSSSSFNIDWLLIAYVGVHVHAGASFSTDELIGIFSFD